MKKSPVAACARRSSSFTLSGRHVGERMPLSNRAPRVLKILNRASLKKQMVCYSSEKPTYPRNMQTSFVLTTVAPHALASCSPPQATLSSGVVRGTATTVPHAEHAVNMFLGVPYAEVSERFSPATPVQPWEGALDATSFGPSCPQNFGVNRKSIYVVVH